MIFYFSATGNCKYVAERIAKVSGESKVSISECIENNNFAFAVKENESIGIISPTYFLGLPVIVKDFLEKIEINKSVYIYFIATYGTTPGQTGRFAKMAANKRLSFNAFYSIKMPDTWTPIFDLSDHKKVARINIEVEHQINTIIKNISEKSNGDYMKNKTPVILTCLYYKTYKLQNKTKKFTVNETCTGCGLCEKKCPSHAIKLIGKKPVWVKNSCIICLGCLHRCPQFSIQYGKSTYSHGQYLNPNTKI